MGLYDLVQKHAAGVENPSTVRREIETAGADEILGRARQLYRDLERFERSLKDRHLSPRTCFGHSFQRYTSFLLSSSDLPPSSRKERADLCDRVRGLLEYIGSDVKENTLLTMAKSGLLYRDSFYRLYAFHPWAIFFNRQNDLLVEGMTRTQLTATCLFGFGALVYSGIAESSYLLGSSSLLPLSVGAFQLFRVRDPFSRLGRRLMLRVEKICRSKI